MALELNDMFHLGGYERLAHAACDLGWVVVLTNNSTCFLVAETTEEPEMGRLVGVFPYGRTIADDYRAALTLMIERAIEWTDDLDERVTEDAEAACPGCGCKPGEGHTAGCAHPEGCGFGSVSDRLEQMGPIGGTAREQELADALRACTGSVAVTVTDGDRTAVSRAQCPEVEHDHSQGRAVVRHCTRLAHDATIPHAFGSWCLAGGK